MSQDNFLKEFASNENTDIVQAIEQLTMACMINGIQGPTHILFSDDALKRVSALYAMKQKLELKNPTTKQEDKTPIEVYTSSHTIELSSVPKLMASLEQAAINNQANFGADSTVKNTLETLAEIDEILQKTGDLVKQADSLIVKEQNKLTVYYHKLQPTDLTLSVLWRIEKPISFANYERLNISHAMVLPYHQFEDVLKTEALNLWRSSISTTETQNTTVPESLREINDVELIECNLLVPKT